VISSNADFFKFVRNNIEKGALVLADGTTAYKLVSFQQMRLPYNDEGFLDGYINLNDKNNIILLFKHDVDLDQKIKIINSCSFKYIVINKRMKNNNFLRDGVNNYTEVFNNNAYTILSRYSFEQNTHY
jgi:hypothetical protein